MKRITSFLFALLVLASLGFSQEKITPARLTPKDARSIAMGGAFTALSSGYQSLYGNPAGFGIGRGMLTLANASFWGFVKPSDLGELGGINGNDSTAILNAANKLITGNGLGLGFAAGAGYTGGGLGIGATVVNEEYARGNTLLGAEFTSLTQVNLVVGLAIKLDLAGIALRLGGDLRPFMRMEGQVPASDMINALANGKDPMGVLDATGANSGRHGVGLAADIGAIATLGDLSLGLTIRDIAPPFAFTPQNLGDMLTNGAGSTDPKGDVGVFVPEITMAFGWSPRLLPYVLDPSLYVQVQDVAGVIRDQSSFWNLLQVGGELKVLSFAFLRAGLNQGWMSVGTGVNLLVFEVDFAAFTEELGLHPGDKPRSGLAANLRLHL